MQTTYLSSKPRYEILDGLRGVAAVLVVAFHLLETYSGGLTSQLINHGYLAVDFFFVLSGFVIGYAYDDRWDRMGIGTFFKRRLIRLHPMLVLGTLFGLLLFYFTDGHPDFARIADVPVWLAVVVCLVCLTLLPLPTGLDIRGWGEMNPLNGPTWSLFWEYLANIAYALFIRRFSRKALAVFVACSALLTLTLCFDIDLFGFLATRSAARNTVVGGWSLTPDQLQIGLTRLLYPFFCGLLISRLWNAGAGRRFSVRGGFWWCALALVVLFSVPRVGGDDTSSYWMNGLYEAFCILLAFPLLVAVGAASSTRGATTAINKFLGDLSYPLYVTHFPLVYWQMSWAATHKHLPLATHMFVSISVFLLAVAVAYASLRLYDEPVRVWLRRKLFGR
ncbi:MAG: acyltransferase [Bacteroidaceae bacterium]|nr:acyltransferase [Bacteroidaceae bacterium]